MPRGVDPIDEARLQGRLWTPAVLNPAAWYDASDVSTISIATGVSEWRDKTGKGRHLTQATTANQPAYKGFVVNSRPGIEFDNTNDEMTTSAFTIGTKSTSFLMLMPLSLLSVNRDYITTAGTSNLDAHIIYHRFDIDRISLYSGVVLSSTVSTIAVNTPSIVCGVTDGANSQIRHNGSVIISGDAGAQSWINGIRLGKSAVVSQYTHAVYCEVVVFDKALSVLERQTVEAYLAWRWGMVQKLDASNPYVSAPPMIGD